MWRGPGSQPLGSPGYRGIKRDVKMLSEHLSGAGYKTGAFGKWHMGSLDGEIPNDRGFDEFRGFLGGAHPYWITKRRSKIMHNRESDRASEGHATELFTGWAEKFIRENAARMTLSSVTSPTTPCMVRFALMNQSRPPRPRPGLRRPSTGVSVSCAAITSPFSNTWITTSAAWSIC